MYSLFLPHIQKKENLHISYFSYIAINLYLEINHKTHSVAAAYVLVE